MILIRRQWTRQPQHPVAINRQIWPGRTQTLLPSLRRAGVLGESGAFTATNANGDIFGNLSQHGYSLGFRPNSDTSPGEVFTWDAGDFAVGADASMIALLTQRDSAYDSYVSYGGMNWGLYVLLRSSAVEAAYVDDPTSSSYHATISGLSNSVGRFEAVGLVKRGNTISVFHNGAKASTTGGNGGIRRSSGSGIGSVAQANPSFSYSFGSAALASICSVPIADGAMFALLRNPWQIFSARQIIIPSSAAGIATPTLIAASTVNIGTTYATPRVTFSR